MPSCSLAVPVGTSARPRPACPGRRRGDPDYDIHMLAYYLLLSSSKAYMSILLHVGEVNVVSTMAEYPFRQGHVPPQTSQLSWLNRNPTLGLEREWSRSEHIHEYYTL